MARFPHCLFDLLRLGESRSGFTQIVTDRNLTDRYNQEITRYPVLSHLSIP